MTKLKPIAPGVAALSTIVLLERFAYYGFRAIIVLFLVGELELTSDDALYYYGLFSALFYLAPLPMGLISDLALGPKKALIVGAGLMSIGYVLFVISHELFMWVAIGMMVLGSGFLKPNINVLLGRLYPKQMRGRDVGFLILYLALNIGAALSSLVVGMVYEEHGFLSGFGLVALAGLLVFVGSFLFQEHFKDNETGTAQPINADKAIPVILLVILASILFWGGFEILGGLINSVIGGQEKFVNLPVLLYSTLNPLLIFLLVIPIGLIWSFSVNPPAFVKLALGFTLIGMAYLLFYVAGLGELHGMGFTAGFLGFSFLSALAELFIEPVVISYITRLSQVKFTASMLGLFYALSYFGNQLFYWIGGQWGASFDLFLLVGFMSLIIGGGLFLLYRALKGPGTGGESAHLI